MAKYALIVNGLISNIVVADADWIAAHAGDYDSAVLCAPGVSYVIGKPIAPPSLDELKQAKFAEIDERTVELISAGFLYSGRRLSLSARAQSYWNGLGNLASNGLLQPSDFPLVVDCLDDTEPPYEIVDAADAVAIFSAAASTVKGFLVSGTNLKSQVRAATTPEECEAVLDVR